MATRLNLTRDQLAAFLQDHEQIKQFERLFSIVNQVEPAPDTQGISVSADTALALAHQAEAQIDQLSDATEIANAALEARIAQLDAELNSLTDAALSTDSAQESRINQLESTVATLLAKIEAIEQIPPVMPHKRSRYGSFYDTTTQTAAAINTAYGITLNTTDISYGAYIGTPTSRVYVDEASLYDLQFSAQFDNASGGNHYAWLWLRKNGVDVPDSAGEIRIAGNNGAIVPAWNYFVELNAGDYIEIMWSVSDTAVQIVTRAASAPVPRIPSMILTVSNNIKGQL